MVKESVHFYQDAGPCISFSEVGARELAVTTRNCSRRLQVNGITSRDLTFRLFF